MAAWAPGRSRRRGPAELLLVPPCACRAAGPQKREARQRARPSASRLPARPGRPSGLNYPGEWGGWQGNGRRPPSQLPARTFRRGSPVPRPLRALPPGRRRGARRLRIVAEKEAPGRSSPHLTCIRRGPRRPSPRPEPAAAGLEPDRAGQEVMLEPGAAGPLRTHF